MHYKKKKKTVFLLTDVDRKINTHPLALLLLFPPKNIINTPEALSKINNRTNDLRYHCKKKKGRVSK